jgi:ubiquitin C-terminal hydrolase
MEQMDAEEFFNQFMDRMEGFTSASEKHRNLIANNFGGKLVTEMIGQDSCKHRSEREEPFIHIQLQVKDKKSIVESLESFVEGELLEKDNAYQCDH